MSIYKKLTAILSIALIAGLGIFGVSSAINAQTQKENTEQREEKRQDKKGDTEENKSSEQSEKEDVDEETAGDNEQERANSDEQSEQAALSRQATISKEQAQTVALQKIAGEIVESELEDEDGKIVYGFEIRDANGKVFGVKVDAKSGALVKGAPDDDDENGENSEKGEQNEMEDD